MSSQEGNGGGRKRKRSGKHERYPPDEDTPEEEEEETPKKKKRKLSNPEKEKSDDDQNKNGQNNDDQNNDGQNNDGQNNDNQNSSAVSGNENQRSDDGQSHKSKSPHDSHNEQSTNDQNDDNQLPNDQNISLKMVKRELSRTIWENEAELKRQLVELENRGRERKIEREKRRQKEKAERSKERQQWDAAQERKNQVQKPSKSIKNADQSTNHEEKIPAASGNENEEFAESQRIHNHNVNESELSTHVKSNNSRAHNRNVKEAAPSTPNQSNNSNNHNVNGSTSLLAPDRSNDSQQQDNDDRFNNNQNSDEQLPNDQNITGQIFLNLLSETMFEIEEEQERKQHELDNRKREYLIERGKRNQAQASSGPIQSAVQCTNDEEKIPVAGSGNQNEEFAESQRIRNHNVKESAPSTPNQSNNSNNHNVNGSTPSTPNQFNNSNNHNVNGSAQSTPTQSNNSNNHNVNGSSSLLAPDQSNDAQQQIACFDPTKGRRSITVYKSKSQPVESIQPTSNSPHVPTYSPFRSRSPRRNDNVPVVVHSSVKNDNDDSDSDPGDPPSPRGNRNHNSHSPQPLPANLPKQRARQQSRSSQPNSTLPQGNDHNIIDVVVASSAENENANSDISDPVDPLPQNGNANNDSSSHNNEGGNGNDDNGGNGNNGDWMRLSDANHCHPMWKCLCVWLIFIFCVIFLLPIAVERLRGSKVINRWNGNTKAKTSQRISSLNIERICSCDIANNGLTALCEPCIDENILLEDERNQCRVQKNGLFEENVQMKMELKRCQSDRLEWEQMNKKCIDKRVNVNDDECEKKLKKMEHDLGECNVEWAACEQSDRQNEKLNEKLREEIKRQQDNFKTYNRALKRYKNKE